MWECVIMMITCCFNNDVCSNCFSLDETCESIEINVYLARRYLYKGRATRARIVWEKTYEEVLWYSQWNSIKKSSEQTRSNISHWRYFHDLSPFLTLLTHASNLVIHYRDPRLSFRSLHVLPTQALISVHPCSNFWYWLNKYSGIVLVFNKTPANTWLDWKKNNFFFFFWRIIHWESFFHHLSKVYMCVCYCK